MNNIPQQLTQLYQLMHTCLHVQGPSNILSLNIKKILPTIPQTNIAIYSRLCSSRAQWPMAPNFCSRAIRKSYFFLTNHMMGTLDFTVSEHWAPFNFPQSTALILLTDIVKTVYLYMHCTHPPK